MSVNDRQGNTRLHFPHLKSLVDLEKSVTPALKGLYRFRQPEQAVTAGTLRHVIHELVPHPSTPTTFLDTVNQFTDVPFPDTLHPLDQVDVHLVLQGGVGDTTFNSMPSNLFSRIEVHVGGQVKQTITDLDQWMDRVLYQDPWEHARHAVSTLYDADSAGVDTGYEIGVMEASDLIRIPISSYLTKCGVSPATCKDEVKLRFYSQVSTNVLSQAVTVKDLKIKAREVRGDDAALQAISQPHLDARFLQSSIEEKTWSFTAGAEINWTLNNFSKDHLCSHMWLFIRDADLSGAKRDKMHNDKISAAWLEDQSNQNMTNGIQAKAQELLYINYPDKFTSTANNKQGVYLIYCPATDPVSDYRNGTMSGAQPLVENMKLKIKAAATGSFHCTVVAMCHKHFRAQKGEHLIQ